MFHVRDSSLMGSDSLKAVRHSVLVLYIGTFVLISAADTLSKKEGWDVLPVPVKNLICFSDFILS